MGETWIDPELDWSAAVEGEGFHHVNSGIRKLEDDAGGTGRYTTKSFSETVRRIKSFEGQ